MALELKTLLDLEIADVPTRNGSRALRLDLYLPQGFARRLPVLVYIHGGGWQHGSHYRPPVRPRLFDHGIAVAAITYRFSTEMPWPAQLHDCKAAIRWLRHHADRYQLDGDHVCAWGISAGAHLAEMLALTGNDPEFAGDGVCPAERSDICGCVAYCGPTDLWKYAGVHGERDDEDPLAVLSDLVGGPFLENRSIAEAASPVRYVHGDAPPHLIVHGTADELVPVDHATDYHEALQAAGVDTQLILQPDIGHAISDDCAPAVGSFILRQLIPDA